MLGCSLQRDAVVSTTVLTVMGLDSGFEAVRFECGLNNTGYPALKYALGQSSRASPEGGVGPKAGAV